MPDVLSPCIYGDSSVTRTSCICTQVKDGGNCHFCTEEIAHTHPLFFHPRPAARRTNTAPFLTVVLHRLSAFLSSTVPYVCFPLDLSTIDSRWQDVAKIFKASGTRSATKSLCCLHLYRTSPGDAAS